MLSEHPIIQTHKLAIGYKRKKQNLPVQANLELNVYQGELVCLIGPNGCGKSTLLRTLAGLQPLLEGEVIIENLPLDKQTLKNKARLIALVLTDRVEVENLTVYNLVSTGRNPYTDWLGNLTEQDKVKIDTAINQVHLKGYEQRFISELSDGERQRAMIAKALVQDTPVILLDEPTAHLDLPNRVGIMMLLHALAKETNKAILLSTHELDLALQSSDKLWLMSRETGIIVGTPEDLILDNQIQTVFANQSFYFDGTTGNFVVNHKDTKKSVTLKSDGNGEMTYWTERALKRNGYRIVPDSDCIISVLTNQKNWELALNNKVKQFDSLEKLLDEIELLPC